MSWPLGKWKTFAVQLPTLVCLLVCASGTGNQDYRLGIRARLSLPDHHAPQQPRLQLPSIVICGEYSVWHQVNAIQTVLQQQGYAAETVEALSDISENALYILLTPQVVPHYPKYFIAYQVEQVGTHWWSKNWGVLYGQESPATYKEVFEAALEVWDYSRYHIRHIDYPDQLARDRSQIKYVPFGWFDTPASLQPNRNIDVLFFGEMNDKRKALLDSLADMGVKVTVTGAQRSNLNPYLLRAKLLLNIHYYWGELETCRVMLGVSFGAVVVSEPSINEDDAAEYAHLVSFASNTSEIGTIIQQYLADDDARVERARLANEYAKHHFSLDHWLFQTSLYHFISKQ